MYSYHSHNRAFSRSELFSEIELWRQGVLGRVRGESEDYLLKVDEAEYTKHLIAANTKEVPTLRVNDKYLTESEQQIPAGLFPHGFNVYAGKTYPKRVYTCHIPVDGPAEFLYKQASQYVVSPMPEISVGDGEVTFDTIAFTEDPEQLRQAIEASVSQLVQGCGFIANDINRFNAELPKLVQRTFAERKAQLLAARNTTAAIGIPLRRRTDAPIVFSVPSLEKRRPVIPAKPTVPAGTYVPDPTLPDSSYDDIVTLFHDFSKELERHPDQYATLKEEEVRNLFLTFLQPQFAGGATGETFNKGGKTDILLRHQNSNLFVAEFKVWKGASIVAATIDQLLTYLTWRDSKAAIVFIVHGKDVAVVRESLKESMQAHETYRADFPALYPDVPVYKLELPSAAGIFVRVSTFLVHLPNS